MSRVVVIGGGIMGGGIARSLLGAGFGVDIVEPDAERRSALADVMAHHAGTEAVWSVVSGLDVVAGAALVIEAAPEDLSIKRPLWTSIGELAADDAILATNTSSLDVDTLAACVRRPERVLATHWFNPAYEIECVEIAPGAKTAPRVIENVVAMLRAAGKSPVVVPNVAGFVANRIQFAAIREAMLCVQEGVPAADVDEIVRTSFAPRLAALGPLANADLGGLDTYAAIFGVLSAQYGDRFAVPAVLADLVARGRFGVKTGAGFSDYTESSAQELTSLRDTRLLRVLAATRDETDGAP